MAGGSSHPWKATLQPLWCHFLWAAGFYILPMAFSLATHRVSQPRPRQHPPSNSALLKEKGFCSHYANRASACSAVAAPFLTSRKCLYTAASGKSLHANGWRGLLPGKALLAPCSHLFRIPVFSSRSGASPQGCYQQCWWLLLPAVMPSASF